LAPSFDEKSDKHRHVSGLIKFVILAQAGIILSFTVWTYQEYLNNVYLQEYIISLFRTSLIADAILSMVTISVFALGTFTLLGSMSSRHRENDEWTVPTRRTEEGLELMSVRSVPLLETAGPPTPKGPRTSRRRHRKPRIDADDLYRSMLQYTDDQRH